MINKIAEIAWNYNKMLKKSFFYCADLTAKLLENVNLDRYIRLKSDVRFVFYHGIGTRQSQCMRYLNDEINLSVFADHLDYLKEKYTLLSLADALEVIKIKRYSNKRPYCNISFDDGLYSVYSKAFPLLKEKAIPFDVFLNTSVIENNTLLWLHVLNYLFSNFGFTPVAKAMNDSCDIDLLGLFKNELDVENWLRENFEFVYNSKLLEKITEKFDLDLKKIANDQNMYLNWKQINEMSLSGVDFYSHTHSHFPLNVFSEEKIIKNEIELSYNIMKSWKKESDMFVSFPFGMERDYGKKAIKYAMDVGYKYIVEVGDGINNPDRILSDRMISRVCLGSIPADRAALFSAIEVKPVLKNRLKKLMRIKKS